MDKDLFGEEPKYFVKEVRQGKFVSEYQKFKIRMHYRDAESRDVCCGTCANMIVKRHRNKYFKCSAMGISDSVATDIRKGKVCDGWREIENEEKE